MFSQMCHINKHFVLNWERGRGWEKVEGRKDERREKEESKEKAYTLEQMLAWINMQAASFSDASVLPRPSIERGDN